MGPGEMKIKLFGRQKPLDPLRSERDGYPTYAAAVIAGQQRYGRGHFLVDFGGKVPSRRDQLLKGKTKRSVLLETL